MEEGETGGGVGGEVGIVFRGADEGGVGVVVAEVHVGFVLEDGVEPAVVYAEGDEGEVLSCYSALCDGGVLRLEV